MCVQFLTWWTLMCQSVLVLPHSTHNYCWYFPFSGALLDEFVLHTDHTTIKLNVFCGHIEKLKYRRYISQGAWELVLVLLLCLGILFWVLHVSCISEHWTLWVYHGLEKHCSTLQNYHWCNAGYAFLAIHSLVCVNLSSYLLQELLNMYAIVP